jgi:hypothetical protein
VPLALPVLSAEPVRRQIPPAIHESSAGPDIVVPMNRGNTWRMTISSPRHGGTDLGLPDCCGGTPKRHSSIARKRQLVQMTDFVKMPHGFAIGHPLFRPTTGGNVNQPKALAEPVALN